jgi:4-amino-4-deoxy-L-arabinose transferase-like glycosyltransferase
MKDTLNRRALWTDEAVDKVVSQGGIKFRVLLLLLALCMWQFFWGLGRAPFYTRGESREGLVVWEMYKTGNWTLPIINGDYIPFKPPLFHWAGVLTSIVTGKVNEFTIRFPSALFATLGVVLVYAAGSRLWNEKTGRLAAFVLATNPEWWHSGTMAQVDMTLTFFMTAALLLFYFMYKEGNHQRFYCMGLALLLAFAALAKGPLGSILPLLIFLVFLGLRRDFAFLKKLHLFSAAVVFLVVAGSWYALALWQGGPTFFIRQIIEENLGTAAGDYGHHQPDYYFVPVFFLNLEPWSYFSPLIAFYVYRRRRELLQNDLLFPSVWLLTVFLFFSLALGKRGVYILPLFPAFALLFGAWWASFDKENAPYSRWLTSAAACLLAAAVLFVVVRLVFMIGSTTQGQQIFLLTKNPRALNDVLGFLTPPSVSVWICLVLFGAAALLILLSLPQKKWDGVFVGFACMAIATTLFLKIAYYPAIATKRTLKPFAVRVGENLDPRARLLFYHTLDYGTIFYSRRHIASYSPEIQKLEAPAFLLMWEEDWQRIRDRNDLKMLDISEGRGPVGKHRLVLIESPGETPISDPKTFSPLKSGDAVASDGD